jgi:signal transduction histidine kinase
VLERRIGRIAGELQAPLLEPLTLVRDEIRRLDHILEDFLQFARPREFVPKSIEVAPVITKVVDLLGGDAERRGVRLERELTPVPPVAGDEERIRQVLVNLCLNALEAVRAGGLVRVSCLLEPPDPDHPDAPRMVDIAVDDDGSGVPADTRDRIFEPFFTTKAKGSGLGLSIVHAIVTQHGGTIRVEESPEGGARFVLRLPRAR